MYMYVCRSIPSSLEKACNISSYPGFDTFVRQSGGRWRLNISQRARVSSSSCCSLEIWNCRNTSRAGNNVRTKIHRICEQWGELTFLVCITKYGMLQLCSFIIRFSSTAATASGGGGCGFIRVTCDEAHVLLRSTWLCQ